MSRARSHWIPVTKATVQVWAIEQQECERGPRRRSAPLHRAGTVLRALGALLRTPPGV